MTKQQIRNSFKTHFKDVEGYFKDENSTGYLKLDERIVDWAWKEIQKNTELNNKERTS